MAEQVSDKKAVLLAEADKYITFSPSEMEKALSCDRALRQAIETTISLNVKQNSIDFHSHGSLNRGTAIKKDGEYQTDHDFVWYAKDQFLQKLFKSNTFLSDLERRVHDITDQYGWKNECLKTKPMNWIDGYLIYMGEEKKTKERPLEIALLDKKHRANFYPDMFNNQKSQIVDKWGEVSWQSILSDIRLMKYVLKYIIGAYKFAEGGIDGVGVEQLVIQSGYTEQKGRTIIDKGDFGSALKLIYNAGYDPFNRNAMNTCRVKKYIQVYHSDGSNRLVFNIDAWNRLAGFSRNYLGL